MSDKNILDDLFEQCVENFTRPDGSEYRALLLSQAQDIASKTGLSLHDIEVAALSRDILPERYSRNQTTLSNAEQLKLLQSHIAIVGLGGLGGTVAEIMARIGVGKITLIDGDSFAESNLNRQLLSTVANLGKSKVEAAARRIEQINPTTQSFSVNEFFSSTNGKRLLKDVNLAIDCLDTIQDRFILEQACREVCIPFVSAAISGTTGQATVIYPEDAGLQTIYGQPEKAQTKGSEATFGTLPFTALYMAAVECAEAATLLLGRQSNLKGKLFIAEVADHTAETFYLQQ